MTETLGSLSDRLTLRVRLAAGPKAVHMTSMSDRLELIAEWIRAEAARPGARSREIVSKLRELARLYEERMVSPRNVDARLSRASDAIERAIASRWTVEQLASVAGMSRAQFARRFRAAFGASPREYLVRRRMARARELLAETDESLQRIAVAVGYESEFAFNRAFRRHHGEPPGAFRRSRQASAAGPTVCLRAA
jgi:AraC-like DNA-binding protein